MMPSCCCDIMFPCHCQITSIYSREVTNVVYTWEESASDSDSIEFLRESTIRPNYEDEFYYAHLDRRRDNPPPMVRRRIESRARDKLNIKLKSIGNGKPVMMIEGSMSNVIQELSSQSSGSETELEIQNETKPGTQETSESKDKARPERKNKNAPEPENEDVSESKAKDRVRKKSRKSQPRPGCVCSISWSEDSTFVDIGTLLPWPNMTVHSIFGRSRKVYHNLLASLLQRAMAMWPWVSRVKERFLLV